jgi:hypothetical protein
MLSNNNNVIHHNDAVRCDEPDLDSRYGKIGISAVAAALHFKSETKKTVPMLPSFSRGERGGDNLG